MVRMSVCHCEICGRTVADKRQLELHINNTHKKKKPYLCYMCGYASAVKHSLVVHMRRHTGEIFTKNMENLSGLSVLKLFFFFFPPAR